MPGRNYNAGDYRYGFGSHEKDDEIKGVGNLLSFNDFGYDPRLGRRWRTDPAFKEYPAISPYAGFGNNPIVLLTQTVRDYTLLVVQEMMQMGGTILTGSKLFLLQKA